MFRRATQDSKGPQGETEKIRPLETVRKIGSDHGIGKWGRSQLIIFCVCEWGPLRHSPLAGNVERWRRRAYAKLAFVGTLISVCCAFEAAMSQGALSRNTEPTTISRLPQLSIRPALLWYLRACTEGGWKAGWLLGWIHVDCFGLYSNPVLFLRVFRFFFRKVRGRYVMGTGNVCKQWNKDGRVIHHGSYYK